MPGLVERVPPAGLPGAVDSFGFMFSKQLSPRRESLVVA
jgi:hypothetical protein